MNLKELYDFHLRNGSVATLLASRRKTSRYLLLMWNEDCADGSTKIRDR